MANKQAMKNENITSELEEYCAKTGLSPSTVCVRAVGNSRFVERFQRKKQKMDEDVQRLRQYMAENPPSCEIKEAI